MDKMGHHPYRELSRTDMAVFCIISETYVRICMYDLLPTPVNLQGLGLMAETTCKVCNEQQANIWSTSSQHVKWS